MKNDARGVGMNAIEFVKKFGWDEAQETVKENSKQLRILSTWEVELKRLVDSWELVEKLGGLARAKAICKKAYDSCSSIISDRRIGFECTWVRLNQAIIDVESVGGGV